MNFVSPEFALMALLFFPLYWYLHPYRNAQLSFLLLGSYALYASWSLNATLILIVYSLLIWCAGNWINAAATRSRLSLSIVLLLSLSTLLLTKYYEFFRQEAGELLPQLGLQILLPAVDFVAPLGISFYTFQAITYLVWRYRAIPCAVEPLRPLVFLAFWPTLFAGPILRAENFFLQMAKSNGLPRTIERAIYLIFLGLIQKMVFASWLADTFVDEAFRYSGQLDALSALAAIWGYSLQIFLDFSGYSLIVTGLALLLGYEVPRNFQQPYLARNLREFWRCWHISLSTFIRDYIYIPLGGNRGPFLRTQGNLLLAMLLSGIWHGANTTFLIWGLLHGLGIVFLNGDARLWRACFGENPPLLPLSLARLMTLLYVGLAWVFFRSPSCEDALQFLAALQVRPTNFLPKHLALLVFTLVFFFLTRRAERLAAYTETLIAESSGWQLYLAGTLLAFGIVFFSPDGVPSFIYYQF